MGLLSVNLEASIVSSMGVELSIPLDGSTVNPLRWEYYQVSSIGVLSIPLDGNIINPPQWEYCQSPSMGGLTHRQVVKPFDNMVLRGFIGF